MRSEPKPARPDRRRRGGAEGVLHGGGPGRRVLAGRPELRHGAARRDQAGPAWPVLGLGSTPRALRRCAGPNHRLRVPHGRLKAGRNAALVLLQARDPAEAIRLKATRLAVVRRGRVMASSEPRVAQLFLEGRSDTLNLVA